MRLVVVGATVVGALVEGTTVFDTTVVGGMVVGVTPLGATVVVADGDCVICVAAVVATGRALSMVVAVASRLVPGDAGIVVCAGAPSPIDAPPHAPSNTSSIGVIGSNRRLTTGLGLTKARLVP